jgi:asparagine synthase (glutamine-hydrolysing)
VISEKEAFEFYESMIYHLDEPLADCVCIPFYYVASLARQHGVSVVQVGEGADELFVGYQVYTQYKKVYDYFWRPFGRFIPSSLKHVLLQACKPFMSNPTYTDLLDKWAHNQALFWGGAIGFNELQKKKILSSSLINKQNCSYDSTIDLLSPGLMQAYDSFSIIDYHMKKLKGLHPDADFFQQLLYLELKQRLPELLLMRADKMSMAVGVEARVPFLDYKLVEFMMHVPQHIKYRYNIKKYLLKKIGQGILPDVIIHRQKVGFAAPTFSWFTKGKYFPAYFDDLKKKQHASDFFIPAVGNLEKLYKNNKASFAVQQWVIQNIWAMK